MYCRLQGTLNADFPPPEKNCIQVYVQVIAFACSFSPAAESPCSIAKFDANDSMPWLVFCADCVGDFKDYS